MRKITEKIFAFFVVAASLLSLTGCFTTPNNNDGDSDGNKQEVIDMDSNIINVYLIGGQSNAVGYGKDETKSITNSDSRFTVGFDNVLYYGNQERYSGVNVNDSFKPVKIGYGNNADTCGAEIGIASAIADENEDQMNAIIKCAWGATHLYPDTDYDISYEQGTWTSPSYIKNHNVDTSKNPNIGAMYRWFEETVTEGIRLLKEDGYTPVIKGMWWMQGEAEMSTAQMSGAYGELLRTLISDVRDTVGNITGYDCSEMPFIFGLPYWNPSHPGKPTYHDAVRNQMTNVANDNNVVNAASVDCTGLAQHDMWHFKAEGQKYLGESFIKELKKLNEGNANDLIEKVSINDEVKLLGNEKGLEFTANLTSCTKENEYGFLVVPTNELTKNNIKNNYVEKMAENNISYQDVEGQISGEEIDDAYYEITLTGKISNIAYENINTSYTIIAYTKDSFGAYSYSSNHVSTSLSSLASKLLYTSNDNKDELQNLVDAGVNKLFNVDEEEAYNNSNLKLVVDSEITLVNSQSALPTNIGLSLVPEISYYVKYTSADPKIVSVDEDGNLTTHKAGKTNVTIECGGKTKTVKVIVENETIDGVKYDASISEGEYAGNPITNSNGQTSAKIYGMVINKNIHLSLEITHNKWSTASRFWHLNDNIEMYIDGAKYIIKFIDGVAVFPEGISHAVVDTVTSNGKLVTTLEMYIEGTKDEYRLKLGMNGKEFSWLGIMWNTADQRNITSEGFIVEAPGQLPSTLTMDGVFNESVWTEANAGQKLTAKANGADLTIVGKVMNEGVLFGVTVVHTKAPEVSLNGGTLFYNYMNIEFVFNGNDSASCLYTCKNQKNDKTIFFAYCKTVQNGDKYTSTFEFYVPFSSIGVSKGTTSIDFTAAGWFETGWCWIFGNNWNATHTLTSNGITKK